MGESGFLKEIGLFIEPDFLDPAFCHGLCAQISTGPQRQSPLPEIEMGDQIVRDNSHRPKVTVDRNNKNIHLVRERLESIAPKLADYFEVDYGHIEFPHVNTYKKGDFINMHRDFYDADGVDLETQRKVSLVVYLNGVGECDETAFQGGELTFYGLVPDNVFGKMGYPVAGETGTLIAYRATTLHGVNEITAGMRHTLSSGLY